jgi:hypothetical protein
MCGNTFAPVDQWQERESNRRQAKPTSDSGWEQSELDLGQMDVGATHEDVVLDNNEGQADAADGSDYGGLPPPLS